MSQLRPSLLPLLAVFLLVPAGCHIHTHKGNNGNDNVDIGTPFGSMQVKTDNKPNSAQLGLTPYPGATVVQKDGDDHGAAEVSMSFGGFQLGVHAVDLQTPDPQDKVVAFYKADMQRYGDVLTCRGKRAVGTPVRTGQGLTCGSDKNTTLSVSDNLELRAGSDRHQHIASFSSRDGGTRIGLVALDLPGSFAHHDASDRE